MNTLNAKSFVLASAVCAFACSTSANSSSGRDRQGTGGNGASSTGATGSGASSQGGGISLNFSGNGNGNGTGGNGGPNDSDAACSADVRDSKPVINDLFMMVDRSVSMYCSATADACMNAPSTTPPPTRWSAVTDALNGFLAAPTSTGFGVGVGFFEIPGSCDPAAYAAPVAPIALLPAGGMAVTAAIAGTMPGGITPTVPALQGAINYAKAYTLATPGHTAAVLFVTDGLPHGCGSDIPMATAVALSGFMGTPQIKTYVVGLGQVANLDPIALAGSGDMVHYFPATGDVTASLTAALKSITKTKISCDYAIPTGGKNLDYGAVNVQVKVGAMGAPTFVGKIDSAAACTTKGGWFYDVNPPAATPTKITLCPQSCDPLTMTDGSSLQVLIGCASEPPR